MSPTGPWQVSFQLASEPPRTLGWLARALAPELAREVPRASCRLHQPDPYNLRIDVTAKDTGSARAASNTCLGWVHLAQETVRRATNAARVRP